ncbi:hypothetical protein NLM33_35640 [Bradyrhizobium sp. CCGUVB1N3]|uniref:hypothetical protein n=1 Tax=Bradyrhizobium sp. CCGUVB1N3 TaxID=2949629 RepID=UPI0020B43C53|nr:hypothetical protein [Bradyrhizobium sp. CCGUVB1N3]MCP3475610.1 hypothetical protein [Bradyrhizobium sp. CCGUVB1N3]
MPNYYSARSLFDDRETLARGGETSSPAPLTIAPTASKRREQEADAALKQAGFDASGKPRKVGVEQYKNRLLAYVAEQESAGSQEVIASGIEHLAARLDAIYEKTCKGVHVDVSEQEARLAVIHTYLFIGEVAKSSVQP